MNNLFKAAVVAAGAALVSQAAQAAFNNNDLVLGFDSPTAANDYVIELGQASGILGSSTTDLSSYFSLSTFNATFSGLNGTSMGVVGGSSAFSGFNIYTTELRSGLGTPSIPGSSQPMQLSANPLKTAVSDIGVMVGNLGLSAGGSTTVSRGDANSFNNRIAPAPNVGSFVTDSGMNPLGTASGNVIYEDLWQQNGNNAFAYKGYFTLDLSGGSQTLSFTSAVPEPSTFALLGGFGALALCFRSRFSGKAS
jgi:PEP-CTERM motif